MFYSLKGKVRLVKSNFVVVEVGGLGYKVFLSEQSLGKIPKTGRLIQLFLRPYWREETVEIFGFLTEEELEFFEILNTVSGIGPRLALGILGLASVKNLKMAISQGKVETLIKAFGVGRKTAERIVLELKDKIKKEQLPEIDNDEEEIFAALVGLGFSQKQAREAILKIADKPLKSISEKIKAGLKTIR